jgi:hypothetical protein
LYHDEDLWLTQKALSGLFNVKMPVVSKHLKNIFESGELEEDSVISTLATTAVEIVYDSADAEKIHMGLTSWQEATERKILKSDVSIAKNYLSEAHIRELNRIVTKQEEDDE